MSSTKESSQIGWDRCDALLVSYFLLVTLLLGLAGFHRAKKFGDDYFHEQAKTLACAVRGQCPLNEIRISHAPGPVLFYALPYVLLPVDASDESFWRLAVAFNCVCSIISLLLLRRVGTMLFGRTAGVLAVALLLLAPIQSYYLLAIIAEPPAAFGFILFLFGWARGKSLKEDGWSVSSSTWLMALGLLGFVLCRPNALVGCAVWAVVVALLGLRGSSVELREMRRSGAALMLFCALLLPVWGSLYLMPNGGKGQEAHLAFVFFFGSFQYRTEPWNWRYWDSTTREGSEDWELFVAKHEQLQSEAALKNVPVTELHVQWVIQDVLRNPATRIRMFFVRLLSPHLQLMNSVAPEDFQLGPLRGRIGYLLFHMAFNMIGMVLVGYTILWLIGRPGDLLLYGPLWAMYLGLLVFQAASYSEPRFMFPVRSALCVMAAAALSNYGPVRRLWGTAPLCQTD